MQRPLIALLALLALTQAPPAQAVTLDRLLAEADTVWTADVPPGSPGRVVKRLLADEPLPIDCLTPLHLAALQQGLDPLTSETAGRLAEPPALAEPWNWVDPENRFRIHFSTRPDSPHAVPEGEAAGPSDPPAYVAEVHAALSAALDILVDDLGFRPPLTDSWIEVYLADPGPGVSGYVVPANGVSSRSDEARGGFLVLGNRLADPAAAAVHQLAHLVLLGYSHHEPVWWHEASAAWMGVLATGDATAEAASIAAHMALPEGGLADEDLARMRGGLLFPAFLGLGEAVPHTLRAVWAECAAVGGDNLLPALEAVAGASGRGSLTDLLRAYYASWVADSAGRSHLTAVLGLPLESPGLSVDVTSYPSAGGSPGGPVAPLGAAFVHLRSLDEPGGVSLTLEGEPEGRWDALLLVRSSPRDRFLAVPMPVDEAGSSRVNYPWRHVSDSLLVYVNAARTGAPATYTYWAGHGFSIPFDLIRLDAQPTAEGVRVQWSTDSETDVFAWNVYRSQRPGRGFQRLNDVPIPAGGGDRSPASYSFLDGSARGRKVYYRVEAITVDGFTESTHAVGAHPRRISSR